MTNFNAQADIKMIRFKKINRKSEHFCAAQQSDDRSKETSTEPIWSPPQATVSSTWGQELEQVVVMAVSDGGLFAVDK